MLGTIACRIQALAGLVYSYRRSNIDPWEILRRFVAETARDDYSWARPNRRFVWQGLYMPGL